MSNFGASFRKTREAAGIPLEKIAADTRISTRFLLAIESEEFHLLPGGIFNRGFIKAYAERLGIDADRAVAEYDSLSAVTQEPLEVLRNAERASTRRNERNLYPIAAAVLVVLVGGYYVANRHSSIKPAAPSAQPVAAREEPARTPQTSSAPQEIVPQLDSSTSRGQATTPIIASPAPPVPIPVEASVTSATPPPAPPPVPIPVEVNRTPPSTPPSAASVNTVPPAATANTATPATSMLVLDVDIKDTTWIRIAADGAIVLADNLQAGTTRRISAERSLDITIGNAAGVSLKINGRDMGQLGTNGRVREFRITPENANRIQG